MTNRSARGEIDSIRAVAGIRAADAAAVLIIALVATVVRMAVTVNAPLSAPVSDMIEYWERGLYIFQHGRLYENSWRMPGYPVALAFAARFGGGPSLESARMLNVAAGTATAALTYWLARRATGPAWSLAGALVVALYPSFLIYTTYVATEAVAPVPLLAALIAATSGSQGAPLVAAMPAILMSRAYRSQTGDRLRWRIRGPLVLLATFAATMVPWWAHNAHLHARFVPLDTTTGINLLIGNGPLASGHYDWNAHSYLLANYLQGLDPTTPAGSDRAASLAWAHVRAHPIDTLRRLPGKVGALLAIEGREHAYLYSFGYFGALSTSSVWLWGVSVLAAFPLVLTAALAGCAMRNDPASRAILEPCLLFLTASVELSGPIEGNRHEKQEGEAHLGMHAISFGDPRFHLPMVPVLAVLATALSRFTSYWFVLMKLAAPGGWNSQLSFDDLL